MSRPGPKKAPPLDEIQQGDIVTVSKLPSHYSSITQHPTSDGPDKLWRVTEVKQYSKNWTVCFLEEPNPIPNSKPKKAMYDIIYLKKQHHYDLGMRRDIKMPKKRYRNAKKNIRQRSKRRKSHNKNPRKKKSAKKKRIHH